MRFRISKRGMGLTMAGLMSMGLYTAAGVGIADASPAVQVCNNTSPLLCFNRAGGGSTQGTTVTGFDAGDIHGSYEYEALSGDCNGTGQVEGGENGHWCPFNDHLIDSAYDGAPIVAVTEYVDDWCAGSDSATGTTVKLEGCPNINGTGGGWSTRWVAPGGGASHQCLIGINLTNVHSGSSHPVYGAVSNGRSNAITITTGPPADNCGNSALWREYFT
jgi:hypothetical protein